MSPQIQQLLALLIPVVVGIITVPLFNFIEKIAGVVDKLPDALKRIVVAIIAALLNVAWQALGINGPTSIAGLDPAAVGTVISSVLAYLLHLASQQSKVTAVVAPSPPKP